MIKEALVCLEGSASSDSATRTAVAIASDFNAKLTAVSDQAEGAALDARLAGATFNDVPSSGNGVEGVTLSKVVPGSRAARNGLASGDVLVGVNNVATPDLAQLRRVFALHPRVLLLSLVRDGQLLQLQIGG